MTEQMSQPEANTADLKQIGQYVVSRIVEIDAVINGLTKSGQILGVKDHKMIAEFSAANYQLSLIAEDLSASNDLEVIISSDEAEQPEVAPITTIPEVIIPEEQISNVQPEVILDQFIYDFCKENKMNLKTQNSIKQIFIQFSGDTWFRIVDVDLSMISYKTESSRSVSTRTLVMKLIDRGLLVDNGLTRLAKRFKINQQALPANLITKSEETSESKKK